jgi:hypothetical protein
MAHLHQIDHCIDILRQVVQCNGDVGIFTRSWLKNDKLSYPDFHVWHKCRKLDPIMEFSRANEINVEPPKPTDAVELLHPPCENATLEEYCP